MIRLGIDRTEVYAPLLKGRRIGLITNYSGVNSRLDDDLTALNDAGCRVVRLFTPEHGLFGAQAGAPVAGGAHPVWGIPIVSLYGERLTPSPEELSDVDMLVYDIQDVGLRYYTYIYTLANCMKAAARANIPLTVLDRPNPLGGDLAGCRIEPRYDSFVGAYRLLTRYGMTPGEVARYFRAELGLDLALHVVPMEGYRRDMKWPATGQLWNIPSPAIYTFHTALCYAGGCFFEASNISEGRGTAAPFRIYGAPFVDMSALLKTLRARIHDDRLAMRERAFTPFCSKYASETCFGVEFIPLSDDLDFMPSALILMKTLADMYPERFSLKEGIGRLAGDDSVEEYVAGRLPLNRLLDDWRAQAEEFGRDIESCRLYG